MTQTVEEVETEVEIIYPEGGTTPAMVDMSEVDPSIAIPCRNVTNGVQCPNEADYLVGANCCDAAMELCQDCFFAIFRDQKAKAGQKFTCNFCNKTFPMPAGGNLRVIRRFKV